MTDIIKHMKEDQVYPCLVFFLAKNPDFGKTFTMADVQIPSEETYEHCLSNLMTLGRNLPSYEEWALQCRESELEEKQNSAQIELNLLKRAVEKFEDIAGTINHPGFVRLVPQELDDYFRNTQK